MATPWIKIEHTTPDKPEIDTISDALGIDPDHVLGILTRLWIWADQQTRDGNVASVTKNAIDRRAKIDGFADAMVHAGWLACNPSGLTFVNFAKQNGQSTKQRALTAKRVEKHKSKTNGDSVSESLLEEELDKELEDKEDSAKAESCGETGETPTHPPTVLTEFVFECDGKGGKTWTLSVSKMNEYLASYPNLDVRAEIRKARQWIRDNPTKRKTVGGMPAFLTRWLNNAQNSGGNHVGNRGRPGPQIGDGQRYNPDSDAEGKF